MSRRETSSTMERRRYASIVLLMTFVALSSACHLGRGPSTEAPQAVPRMVWPDPPDRPRIELLSAFSRASQLGIRRSLWARIASLVAGGGEMQLVRPAGVAASGGRIAVADPGTGTVQVFDPEQHQAVVLEACNETALMEPVAVALLGERIYVSDAALAQILTFDGAGRCTASWKLEDGARPAGLVADGKRARLYVADSGLHRVVAFDLQGNRLLQFGRRGRGAGEFNYPTWLAIDAPGDLYVVDALNFRVQRFDGDGNPLAQFGDQGDGSGDLARPKGIAVDRNGILYLVDALFDAVQMFDRDGHYLMVFGGSGHDAGHLSLPSGVAIDGDRIYVADSYNQRVQIFRFLGGES
ncbi:MAG: hypothetical protein HY270_02495 [Deltaproteobacteria bacterium]|nr:hypothetical protein [Deltaproteobacteria bacterium]